jgi:peroxiredoxin
METAKILGLIALTTVALVYQSDSAPRLGRDPDSAGALHVTEPSAVESTETERGLEVGDAFPGVLLPDLDGKEVKLSPHEDRIVVLWFTNLCYGCQGALPAVEKAHQDYGGKDVTFLAVSLLGGDTNTVRTVVRKYGATFPFLIDTTGDAYRLFGGAKVPPGVCQLSPQFFILNEGKVAYATHFPGTPESDIRERLDELIKAGESKAPEGPSPERPR